MSGATLSRPVVLVGALLLLVAAEAWRRRRRPRAGIFFADVSWLVDLPRSGRDRLAAAVPHLRLALLAVLALAIADPELERRAAEERVDALDVLVALDHSSSMTVVLPGSFASRRFDAAREAIESFAQRRPGDRLGLTVFAKYPRLRCPPTWDHALFAAQLAASGTVQESSEDLTAIGVALADGAARLAASAAARVLVLVTDGANNAGAIEPLEGAALCRAERVRVYAIALGGGEEFGSGRPAPDQALLQQIAAATGGAAFRANDEAGLAAAWRTIDALERAPIVRREGVVERPLAAALVVAVIGALLLLVTLARPSLRSVP